jgi:hypothetical protein
VRVILKDPAHRAAVRHGFGRDVLLHGRLEVGRRGTPDGRRRVRLLSWGACVALTPAFILILAVRVLGRPMESLPVSAIVTCLIFLPVFPARRSPT